MQIEQFDALLPIIVTALVSKIMEHSNLPEDEAISRLYASQVYAALEDEKTKVWNYSAEKLYTLFEDESNGKVVVVLKLQFQNNAIRSGL